MVKILKRILRILNTTIVVFIVILAVLFVGVRLFGVQMFAVLSGSMEPAYPTGSLIYVKEADPASLEAGDVITFRLSESTIATHRIVEVIADADNPEQFQYRTKGDANDMVDAGLVSSSELVGTPFLMIPKLGYFAASVQSPPGSYTAIAAAACLILFVFVTDSLTSDKKKEKTGGSDE